MRRIWLILLSLVPCLASAAEALPEHRLPGETRRDCVKLKAANFERATAVRAACVIWIEDSHGDITVIQTTDAARQTTELARREPVLPWADIHLTPPRGNSQWLIVVYKSETDRPQGDTFFAEVYSLATRQRVLETSGADLAFTDLRSDGVYELVVHEVLAPTRYQIQIGWPRVYVLSNAVMVRGLQNYPALVRELVARLEKGRERLDFICREGAEPCPYARDIELLSAEIAIARTMLNED